MANQINTNRLTYNTHMKGKNALLKRKGASRHLGSQAREPLVNLWAVSVNAFNAGKVSNFEIFAFVTIRKLTAKHSPKTETQVKLTRQLYLPTAQKLSPQHKVICHQTISPILT